MTTTRYGLLFLVTLFVTACTTAPSEGELAAEREVQVAQQRAVAEAELEAQRQREEQLLAEQSAREAVARQETERQAAVEAERLRQAAAEARAEEAEVASRAQQQGPSVEERARVVERQQQRIAELRAQVAANQTETINVESANATLQQAITAAEDLVTTLTEEQQKYATTDPSTGATTQALSKERIAELNAELERLQSQATALSQQP
jgi:hypothetical protein